MHISLQSISSSLLGVALAFAVATPAASLEIVNLQSGNGTVGNPDASITYLGLGTCCAEFPATFTAADFVSAAGGPAATIIGQAHPAWTTNLTCNPSAQWVGANPLGAPETALFAQPFTITTACIHSATIGICWLTDDGLGGQNFNPEGVYINGSPVTGTSGGNYATDTSVSGIDVTALVTPGANYLYLYNLDVGAAVSGVNYSVRLVVEECPVPAQSSTWSGIKSRY